MTEENTNVDNVEEVTDVVDTEETTPTEETFTKAQMEEIITKRVAREKDAATKKIQEAEKYAKLSADEKQKADFDKLSKELEELRNEKTFNSLSNEARKIFDEHEIKVDGKVLARLIAGDAEETKANVDGFIKMFNEAVEAGTTKALTGKSPRQNVGNSNAMTKDSILGIKDASQRIKAIQDNPQLFKQ